MPERSTSRTVLGKTWIARIRERASALWPHGGQGVAGTAADWGEAASVSRLVPLEEAIVAERLRSDRTGDQFCAVVFRARQGAAEESQRTTREEAAARMLPVLESRVRATDVIGRMTPGSIGVVLPHTTPEGATVFARMVIAETAVLGLSVYYRIYPYPPHTPDRLSRDDRAGAPQAPIDRTDDPDRGGIVHWNGSGEADQELGPIENLIPPFESPVWKRAIDIVGAVVGIVCSVPLLLVLAAYIKAVSRGPVFLRQERIGLQGRPFRMWKLRTMHANCDCGVHMKHVLAMIEDHGDCERPMRKLDAADPRIIPGGLWLRRLSIDELPQLLNVLTGEMSLVGPRPEMPYAYAAYHPWHTRRFNVLPGMTGLWQVSGKNRTSFPEMIRLDIAYGRGIMPQRDVAILAKTLPVVLGAANGGEQPAAARLPRAPEQPQVLVTRPVFRVNMHGLTGAVRPTVLEHGLKR